MREIKFRAWDVSEKRMLSHELFNTELSFAESAELDFWLNNDSYILMQYTGLKDKNGKEIYEGDIVKDGYHGKYGIYEVKWEKIGWNFVSEDGREIEIIGNIHENPELISNKN